ncbi:MAG TPA: low temperature requirement protein A [Pseudonocardiaceae bacterium]|nr:low temperature requirement protein A [Pseudonocardiaceae bacterium]
MRTRIVAAGVEARVTPIELFFDLVFVFGLTQITTLMAHDVSVHGIIRGLLVLGLLWWSWVAYAWLCNVVVADEGAIRAAMFAVMAAMFLLALAIPQAFTDLPGGHNGPVVVALCYFAFRALHLMLFWIVARGDQGLRSQLIRWTPSVIGGTVVLLIASRYSGAVQTGLWGLALLADYGGTLLAGSAGWRLRAPGHFAERHGLIIIVALGESIVAIGVGMAGLPISWSVVAASVLGLTVCATLWWAYFDTTALLGERALAAEPEQHRSRLARDAYSFLHLPMVAGIVLLALGLKLVLQHVTNAGHDEPLTVAALYGGVALYLLAHVAFKWRMVRIVTMSRVVVAVILLAVVPLTSRLTPLEALGVLAGVLVMMTSYEMIRFAAARDSVRHGRVTPA